ncbi:hypothetical protein [Desertibacillus haloalkaliphilus]|uniref:hypothetical protein n=1 Tax=Desertibacillus haloalkaliphilus TaxID=1328930 RepID=UPI001C257011|nr:hypothetical protein [Desertibacillus haloalkaliphilus]MBU8908067.1 hypothetical protein [Desertibacillus haloalkaliphilus]
MGKKVIGYNRRQVATFTPSIDADWVEGFNELLKEYNRKGYRISRNRLTEELIADGLKYQSINNTGASVYSNTEIKSVDSTDNNSDKLIISLNDFTREQKELICNDTGQMIIKNLLRSVLGENTTNDLVHKITVNHEVAAGSVDEVKIDKGDQADYQDSIESDEKKSESSFLGKDVKEEESKKETEADSISKGKLSAVEKARMKRSKMKVDIDID